MTLPLAISDARRRFKVGQVVRLTREGQRCLNRYHRFVLTQGVVVGYKPRQEPCARAAGRPEDRERVLAGVLAPAGGGEMIPRGRVIRTTTASGDWAITKGGQCVALVPGLGGPITKQESEAVVKVIMEALEAHDRRNVLEQDIRNRNVLDSSREYFVNTAAPRVLILPEDTVALLRVQLKAVEVDRDGWKRQRDELEEDNAKKNEEIKRLSRWLDDSQTGRALANIDKEALRASLNHVIAERDEVMRRMEKLIQDMRSIVGGGARP